MRVLLDTVTFILAVRSPELLSRAALRVVQNPRDVREMSAISITEIATNSAIGKLTFRMEDVMQGIADLQVRLLPYSSAHAMNLFSLPLHHRDPFDRQLIAQALVEQIPIVTCDPQFRLYKSLTVIW